MSESPGTAAREDLKEIVTRFLETELKKPKILQDLPAIRLARLTLKNLEQGSRGDAGR
jgi:hypothetical protein